VCVCHTALKGYLLTYLLTLTVYSSGLTKWQLKFNSTKCKIIHLGYDNKKATYTVINDRVEVLLEHSVEEKDLGVWTDNKLKFAGHVGHIVAKGS